MTNTLARPTVVGLNATKEQHETYRRARAQWQKNVVAHIEADRMAKMVAGSGEPQSTPTAFKPARAVRIVGSPRPAAANTSEKRSG